MNNNNNVGAKVQGPRPKTPAADACVNSKYISQLEADSRYALVYNPIGYINILPG